MPEQALDIDLASLLFDRPGGERVTEAVRVHLRDAAVFAQPLEDRPHRTAVQVTAAAGSQQQVAWGVSPERSCVVLQRLPRALTEADAPLLVPLGVVSNCVDDDSIP